MNFEKPKKSDFWKNEKNCWRYHHFAHLYQKHNHMRYSSWDLQCDRIFCYFGPFSSLLPRYGVWQTKLSFQAIFCSFNPLLTPKIKIWKKNKKTLDICVIFLYMCTKNQDHMMYGSWDMKCTRQNFLSSWAIFCPFTPNSRKNENIKNEKKSLEISLFYRSVPKLMIIGYTVLEIWQVTDVTVIFYYG